MSLTVGFDISSIPYNRGVSRYTANLFRAMAKKKQVHLRAIGASLRQQAELKSFMKNDLPGIPFKVLPHPVKIMDMIWNKLHVMSPEWFLGDLDIFHSWEMQPPLKKAKLVSTIHDLAMLRFPKTADPYVLAMNERSWKHIRKEAKAVIAVSEATKKDIVELLQIEPERVFVVHEAIPAEAKQTVTSTRRKEVLEFYSLNKPYIFFIGTLEPRKNLKRLIEAWKPMKHEVDLVLAGAVGWEAVSKEDGLRLLGPVSNEHLAALHSGAEVLAYPSLYEGFGLPILDGFYHKIPVVTSNTSGMVEVAGDAAVLVNPKDEGDIRKGLETAMKEKGAYVRRGTTRLKQFLSWEKVADRTIEVYKKAMES